MMDVRQFSAIAVRGKNLLTYDQNKFQWDTASGAWKQHLVVLRKRCAVIIADARLRSFASQSVQSGYILLLWIARRY